MKALVILLLTAVVGLGIQNHAIGLRLRKLEAKQPPTVITAKWEDAAEVMPSPPEMGEDLRKIREERSAEDRINRNLDALSNALSDKGIIWHPEN